MKKPARDTDSETPPESDRFADAPHPRETYVLFGHEEAERHLVETWKAGRLPQSIIIGGAEGIGKATLAWRLARFLRAQTGPQTPDSRDAADLFVDPEHPASKRIEALSDGDVFLLRREWNKTSHYTEIRIDDVRKMIDRFHHASSSDGWRVAIIDAAEDMNRNSANAMLKLVEEPPPRSLFLFVANRPARVMPTIRSRSQMLPLSPLSGNDIIAAIEAQDDQWSAHDNAEVARAAARANGSVQGALRFLSGDNSVLEDLDAILNRMPHADWRGIHALAENVTGRDGTEDFETLIGAVYDWLSAQVASQSAFQSAASPSLARIADLWEKIATGVRQVETFNLDRRPFLITLFNDLAQLNLPPPEKALETANPSSLT